MRLAYLLNGLERSWSLLRQGRFRVLAGKLRHRVPLRPWPMATAESAWPDLELQGGRLVLVVDAGSGGGSTHYRDRMLEDIRRRGDVPVRLEFDLRSGQALLCWSDSGKGPAIHGVRLDGYQCLDPMLVPDTLSSLVVGTLARFPQVRDLIARLQHLADVRDVPLSVDWHDHFLLCPVATLMGSDDYFCGLPEAEVCARCLPDNKGTFDRELNRLSVGDWRADCAELLARAAEIRVFSRSSARLLQQVYGDRFDGALQVIPHSMEYFRSTQALVPDPGPGSASGLRTIGVIGQIGLHKGAALVVRLAQEIRRRDLDLRIVVIGSLELAYPRDTVRETGAYGPGELPAFLAREAVDVVLFPSVCPETFSFVVHEAMALQLPLAVLPMGAQKEYVESYARGLVLDDPDPGEVLVSLQAFAESGYARVSA